MTKVYYYDKIQGWLLDFDLEQALKLAAEQGVAIYQFNVRLAIYFDTFYTPDEFYERRIYGVQEALQMIKDGRIVRLENTEMVRILYDQSSAL